MIARNSKPSLTPVASGAPTRSRRSAVRLAVAGLVVGAALVAGSPALAERGCELPAELTGRTCSIAECVALQANVNSICKPKPKRCTKISGCANLRATRQRFLDCYTARTIINQRCWNGGDYEHQAEAADAITQVGVCDARIALPEPIGCADPCPFDGLTSLGGEAVAAEAPAPAVARRAEADEPAEAEDPVRSEAGPAEGER